MTGRALSLWPVAGVPDRAQPGQQSLTIGSVVGGQTFGRGKLSGDPAGCFQLLQANLDALCAMRQGTEETQDFRPFKVPFAAQMFGSGKTTLGKNFISQLGDAELRSYVCKRIESRDEAHKTQFLEELDVAKGAARLYIDLRETEGFTAAVGCVARPIGVARLVADDDPPALALYLFNHAARVGNRLFVHFDEVGGLREQDLRMLRGIVVRTWMLINQAAVRQENPPRIYFYLSGKGVPLLSLGGVGSPVGTKWIILDKLGEAHINRIRSKMLPRPDIDKALDAKLAKWTGGAPRLLLYTLRYLHHAQPNLSTPEAIDKAMGEAFHAFCGVDAVAQDLFFRGSNAGLLEAWKFLLVMAKFNITCTRETKIPVGDGEIQMETLLQSLNVYIRPGLEEGQFYVEVVQFVERYVQAKYDRDFRVRLLFGECESPGGQAQCVLERLVEHRIIVDACLGPETQTWKQLAHPLLDNIEYGKEMVHIDRGAPIVMIPKFTNRTHKQLDANITEWDVLNMATLHHESLTWVMTAVVRSGRIYRPREMSRSADTFIKQPRFLLEIQDKSGVSAGLTFLDIIAEAGKCVQKGAVVLLIIHLKLSDEVAAWVGNGVLTLKPGNYSRGDDGSLLGWDANGETYLIASGKQRTSKAGKKPKTAVLRVRAGLEIVVPSENAVTEFLGAEDFQRVKKLAEGSDRPDVPWVSWLMGFSPRSGAQLPSNVCLLCQA